MRESRRWIQQCLLHTNKSMTHERKKMIILQNSSKSILTISKMLLCLNKMFTNKYSNIKSIRALGC